jgi:hypothetical protein
MSSQKLMLINESYQENKASKQNDSYMLTSNRQKYDNNSHRELVRLTQAQ